MIERSEIGFNEHECSDDIRRDKWLCRWKDGALIPNYRKPFDMLALTKPTYQKGKRPLLT